MKFENVSYNIVGYTIKDVNRGLTENDIKDFYRGLNYNAHDKYYKDLLKGKFNVSPLVVDLFKKYKSGYPDFILVHAEDSSIVKFVEVKLDGDSLRPNQIFFNNKLSEVADVTVAYFNNEERLENFENIVPVKLSSSLDKEIYRQLENLLYLQRKKGLKPFWVVAKLFEDYNTEILKEKNIKVIAKRLSVPKDRVVWFIKENLIKNKKK